MAPDWRKRLVRRLKTWADTRFPVLFAIRVYLRPSNKMDGMLGYWLFNAEDERGIIALLNTQDKETLIDSFVEEWAHARCNYLLDMEDNDEDPHHHPSFWSEYGRIQRAAREVTW
jgi:hypothetical protein